MIRGIMKIVDWCKMRSPKDATAPVVAYPILDAPDGPAGPNASPPLFTDTHIESEPIVGTPIELTSLQSTETRADDTTISRKHTMWLPLGCGHVVSQVQSVQQKDRSIRGIGGICSYCSATLLPLIEKGEVTPLEAYRLSCVCSDCIRMTVSGHIACPKHTQGVTTPDGHTVYLGPEELEEQKRRQTIDMVLGPIRAFFSANPPSKGDGQ